MRCCGTLHARHQRRARAEPQLKILRISVPEAGRPQPLARSPTTPGTSRPDPSSSTAKSSCLPPTVKSAWGPGADRHGQTTDIIDLGGIISSRRSTRGRADRAYCAMGEWVLREACREAACWSGRVKVAVNISPLQFKSADLPKLIQLILIETGLPASRLELEITESVFIEDFTRRSRH